MRDIKLLLLSITFVTFGFINTFSEDLEVILPKNWKGYIDDTAKIYLATPITGCFNDSLRFPKTNWKGLFVYGKNISFIEDIELEILQLYSFKGHGHAHTQIRYAGMPSGPCDTKCKCPIFFIANLHTNADFKDHVSPSTIYIDRFGESKLTNATSFNAYKSLKLNGVTHRIYIDFDKKIKRVQLLTDKLSQNLYVDPVDFETNLVWAGDVNGDKKIDLLFSRSGKESSTTNYELWFSTSDTISLVKLVDVFSYRSCH